MSLLRGKTILIIGLGLIGGSLARDLARHGGCRILAHGRNPVTLQVALDEGSVHQVDTDLAVLAPQADLVIVTTPTLTVKPILTELKKLVRDDTVITDAASVKGNVVDAGRHIFADSLHRFVPGHPIAGSEQSGYAASREDLYKDRKVILTPLVENSHDALSLVMALWQAIGAEVHLMSAERHDQVLAATSHLPHLLAYTLVNTLTDAVAEPDQTRQVFDFAAGGFADFSRIASSDPVMWRDIFMSNGDATVQVLDAFMTELQRMRQLILRVDGTGMESEFQRAKRARDEFIQRFRGTPADAELRKGLVVACFPGSALLGSYRPAAHRKVAMEALAKAIAQGGTTVIEGVMPGVEVQNAVRGANIAGVPVLGPEAGRLRVFGAAVADAPPATADRGSITTMQVLPADPLMVGILALAAALQPGSSVTLEAGRSPLVLRLAEMGIRMNVQSRGLQVMYTGLPLHAVKLDIADAKQGLSDEEVLVLVIAMLIADGESELRLSHAQARRIWERIAPWRNAGAGIVPSAAESDACTVWRVRGEVQGPWRSVQEINCGDDSALALLSCVVAQRPGSAPLYVRCSPELGCTYPGLLADLAALGFGISVKEDTNER